MERPRRRTSQRWWPALVAWWVAGACADKDDDYGEPPPAIGPLEAELYPGYCGICVISRVYRSGSDIQVQFHEGYRVHESFGTLLPEKRQALETARDDFDPATLDDPAPPCTWRDLESIRLFVPGVPAEGTELYGTRCVPDSLAPIAGPYLSALAHLWACEVDPYGLVPVLVPDDDCVPGDVALRDTDDS